jgi:hypothetical protein
MSLSGIVFGASLSRSKNRVDSDYRVGSNVDRAGHKVLHEDAVQFEGICCDRNIPPPWCCALIARSCLSMRPRSIQFLFATACIALVSCEKAASQGISIDDYAAQVATTMLDTTTTLGVWLKSNPKDSVSTVYPLYANDYSFCRTAVGHASFSNYHTTRFAVFSILPPAGERLPADTLNPAEQLCRLTTIRVEAGEMDSVSALALDERLAKALDAKLGDHKAGTRLTEGTTIGWAGSKTWSRPRARIVLAIVPAGTARKVILEVYTQTSGVTDQDFFTANWLDAERERAESARETLVDADSTIAWSALPSIATNLRIALAEIRRPKDRSDTLRNSAADSALVRAVLATRDTAPHLDSARQASALLAADLVRYATVPFPPPPRGTGGPLYDTLQSIITESEVHGFDPQTAFSRPWLWKAYELDSLGRVGHLAFVRLLARGFNEDTECARSVDYYRTMIDRGEADIRRGDSDPMVHFYVAVGYEAIFDLAQSSPGDYVETLPPKPEGEAARVRALEHFRTALASLQSKSSRREAWTHAARLLARKESRPWLFCAGEDD